MFGFGKFITEEGIANLQNWSYTAGKYTYCDNCMQPFWNWFVTLFPLVSCRSYAVDGSKRNYTFGSDVPATFLLLVPAIWRKCWKRFPNRDLRILCLFHFYVSDVWCSWRQTSSPNTAIVSARPTFWPWMWRNKHKSYHIPLLPVYGAWTRKLDVLPY